LDHLPEVLAIELSAAPHPWTTGIFAEELAHTDTRTYVVATSGDRVVGFGGVLVQVGEAHITNIAVDNQFRRIGIARALMICLMRAAIDREAGAATLEVRVSNVGGQRLYHRFGFVPAGVRPRYYPDGEDAVIMWVNDIAGQAYAARLDGLAAKTKENRE
jgi:[ribosomal protein S18]-alanine N-acetyltransferase